MLATAAAACQELRLGLKSSCSWVLSQPWALQSGTWMLAARVTAWSSQLQQLQLLECCFVSCMHAARVAGCRSHSLLLSPSSYMGLQPSSQPLRMMGCGGLMSIHVLAALLAAAVLLDRCCRLARTRAAAA